MNGRQIEALAGSAGMFWCEPGDNFNTPRGEPYYTEPSLVMPGYRACAFTLKGQPVGVLIFRPGLTELRYCDREGRLHKQRIAGDGDQARLMAGMQRMTELIKIFLGERHPLAARASANSLPA